MDEYKARGENVEKEYAEYLKKKKLYGGKVPTVSLDIVAPKPVPKPPVVIPEDIIGKVVRHKSFGVGVIVEIGKGSITVDFSKVGIKKMGYELCMKNNLLKFD